MSWMVTKDRMFSVKSMYNALKRALFIPSLGKWCGDLVCNQRFSFSPWK